MRSSATSEATVKLKRRLWPSTASATQVGSQTSLDRSPSRTSTALAATHPWTLRNNNSGNSEGSKRSTRSRQKSRCMATPSRKRSIRSNCPTGSSARKRRPITRTGQDSPTRRRTRLSHPSSQRAATGLWSPVRRLRVLTRSKVLPRYSTRA